MTSIHDDLRRLLLAELTDTELHALLDVMEREHDRLAALLEHDRSLLHRPGAARGPLGKLPQRFARTRARWNDCRMRRSAVESEVRKRRLFTATDWDEPTLTDLEVPQKAS